MCAQWFALAAMLILGSITSWDTAFGAEEPARLRMDLGKGLVLIAIDDATQEIRFDPDSLTAQFEMLHHAIVSGQIPTRLQEILGRKLLGSAVQLRSRRIWQIDVIPFPQALAYFGLLGTLRFPQQRPDALLSDDHVLVYRWPATLQALGATSRQNGLLVVAPFTPGLEPLSDDPDTLLWSLRPQLRSVQLIPRNDSNAQTLSSNLGGGDVSMLWMRALPKWAATVLDRVTELPPLLVWSLPSNSPAPLASDIVSALPRGARPAPTMILQLWPQPESAIANCARGFVRNLQNGQPIASAWSAAARSFLPKASDRGGWIILGDAAAQVELAPPPWLRRLLEGLR